ncbi:MAG: ion transporter, partial [Clostridia bacterium]|nr:ion transporter [Clostridia bacterium]
METTGKTVGRAEKYRRRVFQVIETAKEDDRLSNIYDVFMMVVIVLSLVPLAFKEEPAFFTVVDKVAAGVFIIDYVLRLATADLKLKRGWPSFFIYPFTPMALIDLLCILPSLTAVSNA